jgi:hypothetical protein
VFIIYFQLIPQPATEPSEVAPRPVIDQILYPQSWPTDITTVRAHSPTAFPRCRASEPSYLQSMDLNRLRTTMLIGQSLRCGRFSTPDITKRYSKDIHKSLGAAPFFLRHPDIYEIDGLLDQMWPRSYGCYWAIGLVDTIVDVFRRTDPHIELNFANEEEVLRCAELSVKGGESYYFALPEPPAGTAVRYVVLFR